MAEGLRSTVQYFHRRDDVRRLSEVQPGPAIKAIRTSSPMGRQYTKYVGTGIELLDGCTVYERVAAAVPPVGPSEV